MGSEATNRVVALLFLTTPAPTPAVIEARDDLLPVDGDATRDIGLVADPAKNFRVIMKDGRI